MPFWKQGIKNLWGGLDKSLTPQMPNTPTGSLQPSTVRTLMATTDSLLQDNRIEKSHYEQFFRWHAENLPGYKGLYEKFVMAVNQVAQKESNHDFADADLATQRRILDQVVMINTPRFLPAKVNKLRVAALDKDRFYFNTFIVSKIFGLFARTDALILVGYESWRTQPRGLKNYRLAPEKVKSDSALLMQSQRR
ncbi:MAG: hypothetical protein WCA35_19980 [Kovacikia sp.]